MVHHFLQEKERFLTLMDGGDRTRADDNVAAQLRLVREHGSGPDEIKLLDYQGRLATDRGDPAAALRAIARPAAT